ncbi:MAG: Metal binding domain of Ada [Candidatus Parcubacteria bacterium]|jgi:hypothetical protein
MSIQDIPQKINTYIVLRDAFWVSTVFGLVFLLIGSIGLMMHTREVEGVTIGTFEGPVFTDSTTGATKSSVIGTLTTVYASKTGKKYYYNDCSGLARIKEANRVSFASAALAEQAGYTIAAHCHQ